MRMYVLSGKLDTEGEIRLTSLGGNSEVPKGVTGNAHTDSVGNFTLNLLDGSYNVEVLYDNEYEDKGIMIVEGDNITSPL